MKTKALRLLFITVFWIAYEIGDKVELITPARFLFNAGATPKNWNKSMLDSTHIKIVKYESNANNIFPNTAITGGIAITYYDSSKTFKPIHVFIPFEELRNVVEKVFEYPGFQPFSSIVSGRTPYLFTEVFHNENPKAKDLLSKGHMYDISSNAFVSLPDIFSIEKPKCKEEYYRVLGRLNNERAYCWLLKKYARGRLNSYTGLWKVFLPKANGASGMLGNEAARLISKPVLGEPHDIATDTFLCVGPFESELEASATLKYLNSKFARVLLGTLKVTQINSRETWANVPLQDFTVQSDIDWSKPISDIDRQLYAKYGLNGKEVAFIEYGMTV